MPFATLEDGGVDGACVPNGVIGTYLHGALESRGRLRGTVSASRCRRRLEGANTTSGSPTGSNGTAAGWSGLDCSESSSRGATEVSMALRLRRSVVAGELGIRSVASRMRSS